MPLTRNIAGQERMSEVPEEQEPPSSDDREEEEQGSTEEGGSESDQQPSEEDPLLSSSSSSLSPSSSTNRLPNRSSIPLRARAHSYLPGASHPLFPDSLRERQKVVVHRSRWNRHRRPPNQQRQTPYSSAIVNPHHNPHGVPNNDSDSVTFNTTTTQHTAGVPLSGDHVDDGSSSDDSEFEYSYDNDDQTHLTELPILELPSVVLFPGSTIPIRLTDPHWISYLGRQIDASRSLHGHTADEPVRLGILTRIASPQEDRTTAVRNRRQSWTRRGMGPTRLRRLSEQIVLELGDLLESGDEQETNNDGNNDNDQENDGVHDTDAMENNNNNNNNSERRRSRPGPAAAEERRESRRQRRAVATTSNVRKERHPYIGRIGTIASVTYTHGDAAMDNSNNTDHDDHGSGSRVWRSPREQGQLVVTALGTSRFRIDSFAHEADADAMHRNPEYYGRMNGNSMGVKTFLVEELDDEPLSLPPLHLRRCLDSNAATGRFLQHHNRLIQRLSVVSPYPAFVYQLAWPWKMVADILEAVKQVSTFAGLSQSLPSRMEDDDTGDDSDTHYRFLEPLTFSFWMACNMPMSEEEKLCLLEMHSTVERLQYIRQKIADEERIESFIHCKSCGIPLSRAAFMFSVGGAEGTTGAYVNEHGCIHQTVTVREVCEAEVWFQGHAETKDSWFEGYSWTIMSCVFCGSHLGWKFQRVDRREDPTPDRPDQFYGLSAASVATQGASTTSNRRSFR